MSLKNYDASQVSIIVGPSVITGLVAGSFVSVERYEDSFNTQVGREGEVARSKSNNRTGKITLKLQQTSPSNAILSALNILDELSGAGVVPVLVRDASGNSLHAAAEAWIKKPANAEYGKEAGEREWVIECADLETAPAGN